MLARQFADEVGDRYVDGDFETLQTDIAAFGLPINVQRLKDDMGKYRVQYDVWFKMCIRDRPSPSGRFHSGKRGKLCRNGRAGTE